MSGAGAWFRTMLHQEPIIMWSCIIGGIGIIIPVVVPPIRQSFSKPKNISPPPVKQMIEGVTART